ETKSFNETGDGQGVNADDVGKSVHDIPNQKTGTKTIEDVFGDPETRAARVNEAADILQAEANHAQMLRNIQKVEALAQDFHAAQAAAEPGTVMLPNAEVAAAKVTQTVSQTVPRFGVQNTEQFFGTHAERVFDVNLQARRILDELNHAQMIPE